MNARVGRGLALAMLLSLATAACGAAASHATSGQNALFRAARTELDRLGGTPGSGVKSGTTVVLTRPCFTRDGRYASVLAVPISGRVVGQPGLLYARKVDTGFASASGLVTGDQFESRPANVPPAAYRQLHTKRCLIPPPDDFVRTLRLHGGLAVMTVR